MDRIYVCMSGTIKPKPNATFNLCQGQASTFRQKKNNTLFSYLSQHLVHFSCSMLVKAVHTRKYLFILILIFNVGTKQSS